MLNYQYKKGVIRITERIGREKGGEERQKYNSDILWKMRLLLTREEVYSHINSKNTLSLLEPNYLIDLRMSEEEIFKKISRSTRRNIKKAIESDDFQYVELTSPSDEDIEEFRRVYDDFAVKKNISECNVRKLKAFRDVGALVITFIQDKLGQRLCYQTYFCDGYQAYGMYSVLLELNSDSINGQVIGRANKYLDWRNIQRSKERGCSWYNFGGKIMNPDDLEGQNVNKYKLSFGAISGYDLRTYYPISFIGKVFVLLLRMKLRIRKNEEFLFAQQFKNTEKKVMELDSLQKELH